MVENARRRVHSLVQVLLLFRCRNSTSLGVSVWNDDVDSWTMQWSVCHWPKTIPSLKAAAQYLVRSVKRVTCVSRRVHNALCSGTCKRLQIKIWLQCERLCWQCLQVSLLITPMCAHLFGCLCFSIWNNQKHVLLVSHEQDSCSVICWRQSWTMCRYLVTSVLY